MPAAIGRWDVKVSTAFVEEKVILVGSLAFVFRRRFEKVETLVSLCRGQDRSVACTCQGAGRPECECHRCYRWRVTRCSCQNDDDRADRQRECGWRLRCDGARQELGKSRRQRDWHEPRRRRCGDGTCGNLLAMGEVLSAEAGVMLQVNPDIPACAARSASFRRSHSQGSKTWRPRDRALQSVPGRLQSQDGQGVGHKRRPRHQQSCQGHPVVRWVSA
jgi:hypothetical protein